MTTLQPFLDLYQDLEFAVLPAKYGEKRPAVSWKQYQEKRPKWSEVKKWFASDKEQNIAIVCGQPSNNLVVLDFDDVEVYPKFFEKHEDLEKETLVARTGSGKRHVYLKSDKPVPSFAIPQLNLEVRSDRNVVIAPPSKHPSGALYSFVNPTVKQLITVTDLVASIWQKAAALGVKTPSELFEEEMGEWTDQPYEGPDPPCIRELSKGVKGPTDGKGGKRNNASMRLASYWLKFQQIDPATVLKKLKRWNAFNKPPMPQAELKAILESAQKLDRSYGCRVNQAWCDIDHCILLRNKVLRKEAEAEAEQILDTPDVLSALKRHLDYVLVGEENNKTLEFILLLSGKVADPTIKQMILLKSEPGAGKSHLMRLADAFKTKSVGRFTAHALDYSDLQDYEVLKLKELGGMDQEFQGVSTVKFLSSDDQGYSVEVTERDEQGRFGTKQYRVPPITVVTSTTRVMLDPQFERRAWILNPDESKQQTNRIRAWKARLEREKNLVKLGLLKETSYDHSLRVLKAVVRKLNPCNVLLPFPGTLTKVLGVEKLRVRGDFDKFFGLCKLYGVLNERNLPRIAANGFEAALVLPKHALDVLKIAEDPYISMTTELEQRTRRLLDAFEHRNLDKDSFVDVEEREKIAIHLGLSERTVLLYLKQWSKAGFMSETRTAGKGRPIEFKLLYDLETIKQKTLRTSAISQIALEKRLDFQKEAEAFLDSLQKKVSYGKGWTEAKVREALEIRDALPSATFFRRRTNEEPSPKTENNAGSSSISPTTEIRSITPLENPYEGRCVGECKRTHIVLYYQVTDFKGQWGHVCQDCGASITKKVTSFE